MRIFTPDRMSSGEFRLEFLPFDFGVQEDWIIEAVGDETIEFKLGASCTHLGSQDVPFRISSKKPKKLRKFLLVIQALVLLLPAQTWARDFFGIIDFKPSVFTEQSTSPFFFSIGRRLKFGNVISESSPTLFEDKLFNGDITAVYPSPDETKAAIVSGGNLYVAEAGKTAFLLLNGVDNLAAPKFRAGDVFYKYPTIQWDASSRAIYIVRDKKQAQLSEQHFSRDATLVRLDITDQNKIIEVVPDFRSMTYFLVGDSAVCFNYAAGHGDVVWKCSDQGFIKGAKSIEENSIVLADGTSITGKPFVSYKGNIHESEIWLTRYGFSLNVGADGYFRFFSRNRSDAPVFVIKGAYDIKGHYIDGILQTGCVVLPEGRYALLNVSHDNFAGQLLVDSLTGQYRKLPRDTRVYRNLNTSIYKNVKIGLRGLDSNEFLPTEKLRTSSKSSLQ